MRPKIVWGNLNLRASYALVEDDSFVNAPSPMIVPASRYLLAALNSKVVDYYIRRLGVTRNGGYFEYKPMFVQQAPVPVLSDVDERHATIEQLVADGKEQVIDDAFFDLYGLTPEERAYVEENFT